MAALGMNLISGGISAITGKKKTTTKSILAGGRYHRRRRRYLTQADMNTLMQIKNTLGKTAAAQALPYFLGRR